MKWILFLSLVFFSVTHAAEKPKPHKKTAKSSKPSKKSHRPKKSKTSKASKHSASPKLAAKPPEKLLEVDKLCRRNQSWGKLQAVREQCADLQPKTSAVATYWRLTLSDDPNDLRKGFSPASLAKGEVDSRLLLCAGRYHFARGQTREMGDLVELSHQKKLAGPEIDTLRRLAAGK